MKEKKFDLNKIPKEWLEISDDGKVIIKNEEFAKKIKDSIEKEEGILAHNGGCDCIS